MGLIVDVLTGLVRDATITRSIPLLDEAALEAARQWQFEPGSTRANLEVSLDFRIRCGPN